MTDTTTMTQKKKILHILSQRPGRTGSGVTLDAIIRHATAAGYEQWVIVGTPSDDPRPDVGGLPAERIYPLVFLGTDHAEDEKNPTAISGDNNNTTTIVATSIIPYKLPGMSDVMPYPSSRWSDLTEQQITLYCDIFAKHIQTVIETIQPDFLYSHHIWLLSSMLKSLAPKLPLVTHCHATGLRQMTLCPYLADRVRIGCSTIDQFVVLHDEHKAILSDSLQLTTATTSNTTSAGKYDDRIHVVGAGYKQDVFHAQGRTTNPGPTLVFAGKLSNAKGLPQLLDAIEQLANTKKYPDIKLHVAGSGAGVEAQAIQRRMERMVDTVVIHGMLSQDQLANLLRQSAVFVLPSFYEGLPLVVVEAAACGCHVVCTTLTGVTQQLQPYLGKDTLELVSLPRLRNADVPYEEDLPEFVSNLVSAIDSALQKPPLGDPKEEVKSFTWEAVFQRIENVWFKLLV